LLFFTSIPGTIVNPDETVCEGRSLLNKAQCRANALTKMDVGQAERVVISHGGTDEFFADLYAVWRVGACAVCVNEAISDFEFGNIVEFTQPKLILVGKLGDRSSLGVPMECFYDEIAEVFDRKNSHAGIRHLDDPALILFTSGTTGTPKGVVHSFRSILARLAINRDRIESQTLRKTLCMLPTHFGHGLIGNCLTSLYCGGDLILHPLGDVSAFSKVGPKIDAFGVTFLSSVPSMWRIILKMSPDLKRKTLEQVNIGSAPLSVDLWHQIIAWTGTRNVVNMYGITETANWISGASATEFDPEEGLVGRVWAGTAVVRSQSGEISTVGEGEILVQTPSLMQGYLNQPGLTDAAFEEEFFCTGDTGSIDKTGVIRIRGRRKLEINYAGIKVNPEEIEALVEKRKTVAEACVFAVPDEIAGELIGVAVVFSDLSPEDGSVEISDEVENTKAWLRDHVIEEKVPKKWYILGAIPKTERGKIDRNRVLADCLDQKI
jgi:oxalate---CoA ligase